MLSTMFTYLLTIMSRWSLMSYSNTSDLGNQQNNGPHQDHIYDKPSARHYRLNIRMSWAGGG